MLGIKRTDKRKIILLLPPFHTEKKIPAHQPHQRKQLFTNLGPEAVEPTCKLSILPSLLQLLYGQI